MKMATMKFRQLIDMAIGSPEPGNVNFNALHCLLNCIADKLGINDEIIDFSKCKAMKFDVGNKESNHDLSRILAGSQHKEAPKGDVVEVVYEPEHIPSSESNAPGVIPEAVSIELHTSKEEIPNENFVYEPEHIPSSKPNAPGVIPEAVSIELHLSNEEIPNENVVDPADDVPQSPTEKQLSNEIIDENHVIKVLSASPSTNLVQSNEKFLSLDNRVSKLEMSVQKLTIPEDFHSGILVMRNKIDLAVDQLLLLTFHTLSKKPDLQRAQQLHTMAQSLREIHKDNLAIEGSNPSLSWSSLGLQLNKDISEYSELLEASTSGLKNNSNSEITTAANRYEPEDHLCYTPDKTISQLMELKGDFGVLTNKVNELTARLLQQESQRTLTLISDLQEQIQEVKQTATNAKEHQDRTEMRVTSNKQIIENTKSLLDEITAEKVDKSELEILLADKVNYNQLQQKVSLDQMHETQSHIDKKFCELLKQISENDMKFTLIIDNLRDTLGFAAVDGILKTFKEQIQKEIRTLHELLETYIDATNDECAAAGARTKVLKDLACLSCDTNCVMRTVEKSKVAKLPSAHASTILSPLITYELSSIRKSGIMGYYRKDEFPHAPNAWRDRQGNGLSMKQCVPRHAGGAHTTNTAHDRVNKVMLNKK